MQAELISLSNCTFLFAIVQNEQKSRKKQSSEYIVEIIDSLKYCNQLLLVIDNSALASTWKSQTIVKTDYVLLFSIPSAVWLWDLKCFL